MSAMNEGSDVVRECTSYLSPAINPFLQVVRYQLDHLTAPYFTIWLLEIDYCFVHGERKLGRLPVPTVGSSVLFPYFSPSYRKPRGGRSNYSVVQVQNHFKFLKI